jgi:hypothetical protein
MPAEHAWNDASLIRIGMQKLGRSCMGLVMGGTCGRPDPGAPARAAPGPRPGSTRGAPVAAQVPSVAPSVAPSVVGAAMGAVMGALVGAL